MIGSRPKPSFRSFSVATPISLKDGPAVSRSCLGNSPLPVVWTPDSPGVDLVAWAKLHVDEMQSDLQRYGGVLLRGFENRTVDEFHQVARIFGEEPLSFASNIFPSPQSDLSNLRTGSTYPPQLKLVWHNENSFDECRWTRRIMFYARNPAPIGGATPVCDCRTLFKAVHPDVREEFMRRGISYIANYHSELGNSWKIQFNASTREEVEEYCKEWNITCKWIDGERLRIYCHRPAVIHRPGTGELLWFNSLQIWHPYGCAPETINAWQQSFAPEDFPKTCTYGDGKPIPDDVMAEVYRAYGESEITFEWRAADILILDNILVTHARDAFTGPRQHYVALDRQITLHELASCGPDGAIAERPLAPISE